jgi:ribonucleotide reductase beta subunit family protein with ferritin-like domain
MTIFTRTFSAATVLSLLFMLSTGVRAATDSPSPPVSIHADVYFEALETSLSEQERTRLAQLADSAKAQLKATRICAFLISHAIDAQVRLASARVEKTSEYLESIGIPSGVWDVFFVIDEQRTITNAKTVNSWIDVDFSQCLPGDRLPRDMPPTARPRL